MKLTSEFMQELADRCNDCFWTSSPTHKEYVIFFGEMMRKTYGPDAAKTVINIHFNPPPPFHKTKAGVCGYCKKEYYGPFLDYIKDFLKNWGDALAENAA